VELSKSRVNNFIEDYPTDLDAKITGKKAEVGVIGVGYVGQALVQSLTSAGFKTFGYDLDENKLRTIKDELFTGFTSVESLEYSDVICVCVPTPLDSQRKPDLTFLMKAIEDLAKFRSQKQLIIVESTVAPGTLRKIVLPSLEKYGRRHGSDFHLALSPERVDPGNRTFALKNTPKIIGGVGETATRLASLFYSKFIDQVVVTSTPEVAELTKMLENTFRLVNISLMNEIKIYAEKAGIDIWEAIDAASTKPYAFMAHYPGPGVGGHCIPIDPVYLLESAKEEAIDLSILRSALKVNEMQPGLIIQQAKKILNGRLNGKRAKMLVVGIAYKPSSSDTRESPAIRIIEIAESEGFEVTYFDPLVPRLNGHSSQMLTRELLRKQDVIIIATHHPNVQYELIRESGVPVIDTRNIMKDIEKKTAYQPEESEA